MPTWPDGVTLVTIRHTPVTTGGRIFPGSSVTARASERLWADDGSILPADAATTVQADGSWEIQLPAVDVGLRPSGAAYRLTEHVPGAQDRSVWVAPMSHHAPGPVDLVDVLTPAPAPGGGITIQTGPATDPSMAAIAEDPGSQFRASLTGVVTPLVDSRVPAAVAQALGDDAQLRPIIEQTATAAVEDAAAGLDIVTGSNLTTREAAAGRRDVAMTALAAPAREVGVRRVSATRHELLQRLSGDRWVRFALDRVQPGVGGDVQHIRGVDTVRRIMGSPDVTWTVVDDSEPAFSFDSGWTNHGREDALGGRYHQSTIAGSVATWTTPAATALRLRTLRLGNGGLMAITIDGDATAANLCETAADWCARTGTTDGVLTTHTTPGTLAPDQRIIDCYSPAGSQWDAMVPVASDLTSVAHTVTITSTAYTTGSTASRAYVSGGEYGTSGGDPVLTWTHEQWVSSDTSPSVWEYALSAGHDGQREWIGNGHGRETQTSLDVYVDGELVALSDGQDVTGAEEVTVVRRATLTHPTGGGGTSAVEYRLTGDGLTITCHIVLDFDMTPDSYAQMPMLPVDNVAGAFTRGYTSTMPAPAAVGVGDGTLVGIDSPPAETIVMWQPTGHLAAALTVPEVSAHDQMTTYIQDRVPSSGAYAKAYVQRRGLAIPAGTPIRSVGHYRIGRLPDPTISLTY